MSKVAVGQVAPESAGADSPLASPDPTPGRCAEVPLQYRLAANDAWTRADSELLSLATLARTLLPDVGSAIVLLDRDMARCLGCAVDGSVRLWTVPAGQTLCERMIGVAGGDGPWLISDTVADDRFAHHPLVDGTRAALRSYGAAALTDPEGRVFGTVCAYSTLPGGVSDAHVEHLSALAAAVVAAADLHRRRLQLEEAPPAIGRGARELEPHEWTIDDVLARKAIATLFQPIVHLASGEIVGFEALTRGPKDSPLESPLRLIEAASRVGRLGELDWLCRAKAMSAAASAQLPSCVSWLINVEPAGLARQCPVELQADIATARTGLRIILEVIERAVEGYATELLHATDQARRDSWGVALDDVGSEVGQLALLPFLRPDVVKLDMSLLRGAPAAHTAAITGAVAEYAERTGAVILAEGIETEAERDLAEVFGATYGQGWYYGRPGALPEALPLPRHVIPLHQRIMPVDSQTPFDLLASQGEPREAAKQHLTHISQHLEAQSATQGPAVLLVSLDDARHLTGATRARLTRAADASALTMVLADGLPTRSDRRWYSGSPRQGSRLGQEWVVALITPHYAAAFVARRRGEDASDRFDYFYTHDRDLVVGVMRSFLAHVRAAPPALPTAPITLDPVMTEGSAVTRSGRPVWRRWGLALGR